MASSEPSCFRRDCLVRNNKQCYLIFHQLLAFLVVGHLIIQNGVVCTESPESGMSCYSCDQSGSEAGDENDNDLCINPNPATDENPSTTLACPEPDNKCASIRLVHHYGDNLAVVTLGADVMDQEDKGGDDQGDKKDQGDGGNDQKEKIDKEDERKLHEDKEKPVEHDERKHHEDNEKSDKEDERKHPEDRNSHKDNKNDQDDDKDDDDDEKKEDKKVEEDKRSKEDKKDDKEDDDDDDKRKRSIQRRKRSIFRRKRSSVVSDTSYVEIARKGCTSEKRVKAALDCFRNLFHHPYQRYLGKCTVTQFGRDGFLLIKQKCEPGTLPKDMRIDMDRQDKFYLLLCTCEGDLCNDKELLELDKRVFIPEVRVVGNGTPWDEGWGRLGSGGAHEEDDDDEAMRKKFKNGGEIRKVGWVLILVTIGVMVSRGKF